MLRPCFGFRISTEGLVVFLILVVEIVVVEIVFL
jgi:hypothetical protein